MGRRKEETSVDENDPWRLIDPPDTGKQWKEKTCGERIITIFLVLFKIALILGFLYIFVCSLDFLSNAFRLLGGKRAGETFRNSDILSNPIADLTLGVLATVLLQSSSTTTSIVVAMVSASLLPIKPAIFIVMGANIGTSVTNTIVAMGQSMDRNEFRKAFAGATVHDMFNWLSVFIILPIEWISGSFGSWKDCGLLCQITDKITKGLNTNESAEEPPELLKVITKPFTSMVIQIDKDVIKLIAQDKLDPDWDNATLVKKYCEVEVERPYAFDNNGTCEIGYRTELVKENCDFWFADVARDGWSDAAIGICLLIFALGLLIMCLVGIVKLLHSLLKGQIAKLIKNFLNSNLPGKFGRFITGYLAILIGAGLTILVQSSSIFTSALTPLVGCGVLHIKRMYPLTLGANIGTTVTAILAALASDPAKLDKTLQIALCHLFFNIWGILIWYPFPVMRKVPIALAKILGNTTAKYRWFAMFYLIIMFFVFPAAVFGLSLAGWKIILGIGLPIFGLFWIIVIINVMQNKCPNALCPGLRDWDFLPEPLRSLEPYDKMFRYCCICCRGNDDIDEEILEENGSITRNGDVGIGMTNGGYEVETNKL